METDLVPGTQPDLVHRVCQFVAERENLPRDCEKCPATIDTPYGRGKQGCRLIAEELIMLVREESCPRCGAAHWPQCPEKAGG